jgi:hypothetical protein
MGIYLSGSVKRVGHHLELTRKGKRVQCEHEAELKRRDIGLVEILDMAIDTLDRKYEAERKVLYAEWVRALRAKPGSKYDATRKGK